MKENVDVAALVERLRAMETAMQMTFHQPPTRDALLTVRAAAEQLEALTQPVSDEDVGQVEHDLRFYGAGMYTQDTMTRGADMIARLVRERDDARAEVEKSGDLQARVVALEAEVARLNAALEAAGTPDVYGLVNGDATVGADELSLLVEDGEVCEVWRNRHCGNSWIARIPTSDGDYDVEEFATEAEARAALDAAKAEA